MDIREEVGSGGRADNRPVLAGIRAELRRGDVLVVAKLDRLTRSLLDFADVVAEAQRRGWTLLVLDQGFDLNTTNGRAMAGMLAVFAQWERELIGERIRSAFAVKRAQGDPDFDPADAETAQPSQTQPVKQPNRPTSCGTRAGRGPACLPTAGRGRLWLAAPRRLTRDRDPL